MTKAEASVMGSKIAAEINRKKKNDRILLYNKNPNLCKFCKKPHSYEKRKNIFCNHSCSQSFNNKGVRRHGGDAPKCLNCGKEFRSSAGIYCSIKCYREHKWKIWCDEVERKGFFEGYDGSDFGGHAAKPKKYLLLKQNEKCSICDINEWQGKPVPFILDHIDGDSNNWKIENVRVICRNCDGQLPTYCGRNRGKGKRLYSNFRGKDGKNIRIRIKNYKVAPVA